MSNHSDLSDVRFVPLRPASRKRILMAIAVGPFLWLIAIVTVAVVVHRTSAIELGLLIAFISAAASAVALALLRQDRVRQEARYAARG